MSGDNGSKGEGTNDNCNTEQNNVVNNKNETCIYPAAKILLETIQREDDREYDRKKTLESRAGIFVAFSSGVMAIISNSINFNFFESIDDRYVSLVVLTLIIIPLTSFLTSLILLGSVLITRDYRGILIDRFTDNKTKQQEDKIASDLVDTYREKILYNKSVNKKKATWFRWGVILQFAAFILISLLYFVAIIHS